MSPGYAYASLNQLQQAQDVFARGWKGDLHGTGFWKDLKAAKTRGHQISNLMAGLEYDPDNPVLWSNLAVAS